jgi:hypothetical protein
MGATGTRQVTYWPLLARDWCRCDRIVTNGSRHVTCRPLLAGDWSGCDRIVTMRAIAIFGSALVSGP